MRCSVVSSFIEVILYDLVKRKVNNDVKTIGAINEILRNKTQVALCFPKLICSKKSQVRDTCNIKHISSFVKIELWTRGELNP